RIFPGENGPVGGGIDSRIGGVVESPKFGDDWSEFQFDAQIGEQKEGKIKWLCDGVLINNRWILSAAHCFTERDVNPNVVRLGDLDKSDFKDPPLDRKREFIRDYPIQEVVPYPEFNVNERYHDIVLIQIPRPIPLHSGDSGAPIFYLKDDSDKSNLKRISITSGKMCGPDKTGTRFGLDAQKRRFVLAGIVSGGFGCGLKEFPGLYTPINKPNYMQWIKEVAFKDYV
ncbi:Plasma kallikrein, partial [Armadillidium vulgare]